MKKFLIALLSLMLVMLTACSDKEKEPNVSEPKDSEVDVEEPQQTDFMVGNQKITLKERTFQDEQISMLMPVQFFSMDEEEKTEKYPDINPETIVYSNDEHTVDVLIEGTDTEVSNSEMPTVFETIYNLLMEKEVYQEAEFVQETQIDIADKNVGVIELITKVEDEFLYTKQWYSSQAGKLLVITFNCPDEVREEWLPVAEGMLESLRELESDE